MWKALTVTLTFAGKEYLALLVLGTHLQELGIFENVLIILNVCLPLREFKEVLSSNDGYDMIAAPSAVNLSAL